MIVDFAEHITIITNQQKPLTDCKIQGGVTAFATPSSRMISWISFGNGRPTPPVSGATSWCDGQAEMCHPPTKQPPNDANYVEFSYLTILNHGF
jgi:hypothetical protein